MTMTREMLKEELVKRGLRFIEKEVVKNGEVLHAFEFETKEMHGYGVAPLLYPDDLITVAEMRGDKIDKVVDEIIEAIRDENVPKEISSFLNKEYILKHLYIEVEKANNNALDEIRKQCEYCEEIESFLVSRVIENDSLFMQTKLKRDMLDRLGIDEETAWKIAEKNTFEEGQIFRFSMDDNTMLIATNKYKNLGAVQFLNKELMNEIKKEYEVENLVILPSSIHECIVVPKTEDTDLDDLSRMVCEVNASAVAVREQLANRAFII